MVKKSAFGTFIDNTWSSIEKILKRKGFKTIILDSDRALRRFIYDTIPDNCIVGLGSSLTTGTLKIRDILREKGNKVYYAWSGSNSNRSLDTFEDLPKPDFFLTTAENITAEGKIINNEFENYDKLDSVLPQNIIAFSDIMHINQKVRTVKGMSRQLILDEKPELSEITVAVVPFSTAS